MRAPDLEEIAQQAALLSQGPFQAILPVIRAYPAGTVPYEFLYRACIDILGADNGFTAFHWLTYTYKEINGSSPIMGVGYEYPELMKTLQRLIDEGTSLNAEVTHARS